MGFFRRSRGATTTPSEATLDFGMLTATLHACQSASITARLQAQAPAPAKDLHKNQDPLVELLLGGPAWRDACDQQGGSFNAAHARGRCGND